MIFNSLDQINTFDFPVILIGSGPASITIALELEKKKISTLIIEAGKERYDHESQQNYDGEIVGDSIFGLTHNRLRQLGGTSGHWGGWCRPLEEYNFAKWNITKDTFTYRW